MRYRLTCLDTKEHVDFEPKTASHRMFFAALRAAGIVVWEKTNPELAEHRRLRIKAAWWRSYNRDWREEMEGKHA